jgi:hypothetical protein
LTASHRKAISRMIVSLSLDLAQQGDAQMRRIHDLYSTSSLDDMDAEQIVEMREMLAEMGVDLPALDEQTSLEQAAKAALEALAQKASQNQETEALRKAKRDQKRAEKAKADPKKLAALASKDQAAQDAQTALKAIYRQLARQLHPDRAISEAQRLDNHSLMSQVNVAYEKQDLLALLKLQLQASQIDASAINSVAEDKLKTWVALLRRQAKELAEQQASLEMHMRSEFCMHPREDISRQTLDEALEYAVHDVEIDIQSMQEDLAWVQNDAGLKRWAKQQSRALQDQEDMERHMNELAEQFMRERQEFFTSRPNQTSKKKKR